MKTRLIILCFFMAAFFMSPEILSAQFKQQINQREDKKAQPLPLPKNDPEWERFKDKTLKGNLPQRGEPSKQQQTRTKSNKPITKTFLGCTFRVTTMEEAVRIFSNKNYKGEVGESEILLYGVKFADRDFPFSQFVFNNDKFCAVNFISVYTRQKEALNRREDLKRALSKKYNLVEDKREGYKCYFAGDNDGRFVVLVVQAVDDSKSDTGKAYWVYLQYVDTKQAGAINDDL